MDSADVEDALGRLGAAVASGHVQFPDPAAVLSGEELLGRWQGVNYCLHAGGGLTSEALEDVQKIYAYIGAVITSNGEIFTFSLREVCFESLSKITTLLHEMVPIELLIDLLTSIDNVFDVLLACVQGTEFMDPGVTGLLRLYMLQVVFNCVGFERFTGRTLMELTQNDVPNTVGLVAFVLGCREAPFELQSAAARCLVDLTTADSVFFNEETLLVQRSHDSTDIQTLTEMLFKHVNDLMKSIIQFEIIDSFGLCICQHQQNHTYTDIIVKYFLTMIHNSLLYSSANQEKLRQHLAIQSTVIRDIMIPYVRNILPVLMEQPESPEALDEFHRQRNSMLEWQTLRSVLQTFVVVTFNIDVFREFFLTDDLMMVVTQVPGILADVSMLELVVKISVNVDLTKSPHGAIWIEVLNGAMQGLDESSLRRLQRRMSELNTKALPYSKSSVDALEALAIAFQGADAGVEDDDVQSAYAEDKKLQHSVQDDQMPLFAAGLFGPSFLSGDPAQSQQWPMFGGSVFAAPAEPVPLSQPLFDPAVFGSPAPAAAPPASGSLPALVTEQKEKKKKGKIRITSRSVIDAPEDMRCAIDGKVAIDPLRSPYGHLFERKTLEKWMQSCGSVCPVTSQALRLEECSPDKEMKKRIAEFLKSLQEA